MSLVKNVRRFWRGRTKREHILYVLLAVLLAVAIAFTLFAIFKPEESTEYTKKDLLFDAIEREGIQEIVLHHQNGKEFSVKSVTTDVTLDTGEVMRLSTFVLFQGERSYSLLSFNEENFSELIVSAGTHYIYDTVVSAPKEGDADYDALLKRYEQKLGEYGLDGDAPYYEIKDKDGNSHRVYYGKQSATGVTYYVRLEGRDTVYMTTGAFLGDLLNADAPVTLLNAEFLAPLTNAQAYAYVDLFSISHFERLNAEKLAALPKEHRSVGSLDRVGYTAVNANGDRVNMITLYPLASEMTGEEYREAFLGRSLGACDFTFNAVVGKNEDGSAITEKIHVVSIDFVDRGDSLFSASFVQASQRDLFHQYSIYKFTKDGLRSYLPNTDGILDALEKTSALTGSIVSLDFNSADTIEKYKLYAHMIELDVPMFSGDIYRKDENGNDTSDLAPDSYTKDMLYVSDVTENGTRYVGSTFYGIVAEVDATSLSYLDKDLFDWVEPSVLNTSYERIEHFRFDWSYSQEEPYLSTAYDFYVYYKDVVDELDGSTSTVIPRSWPTSCWTWATAGAPF